MTWAKESFAALLSASALGSLYISTRSRRQLREPASLLSRLHKGELSNLDSFVCGFDDLIANDEKFWDVSGGLRGLIRKRQNVLCLVQICQTLCGQNDPATIVYMTRRSLLLSFMIWCSLPESLLRLFVGDLPHLCARMGTQLYWDMTYRTRTICEEYRAEDPALADAALGLL